MLREIGLRIGTARLRLRQVAAFLIAALPAAVVAIVFGACAVAHAGPAANKLALRNPTSTSPNPYDPGRGSSVLQLAAAVRPSDGLESLVSRNEASASQRFYLRLTWRLASGSAAATRTQLVPIVPPYQTVDVPGTSTKWVAVDGAVSWDGRLDTGGCIPDGPLPGTVQMEYVRQTTTNGATTEKVIDVLSATASISILAAAPAVTLTRPSDGLITNVSSVPVEGAVVGGIAPVTLRVNGVPVTLSGSGAFSTTITAPEGSSSITAEAEDCGGRKGQAASVSVVLDTVPPQVSISVPAVTNLKTPPIAIHYSDGGSGVAPSTLRVLVANIDRTALFDAGATSATLKPGVDLNLEDGAHDVQASVQDRATNSGSAQVRSVFVDTRSPVVTLTPANGANLSSASPTLRATLADPSPSSGIQTESVVIELDDHDVTALATVSAGEVTFTPSSPLAEGSHYWRVRAADTTTNVGAASATLFVDTRAPTILATPSDNTTLNVVTPTLSASFQDPSPSSGILSGSFTATVDGQPATDFAVTSSGATFTPSTPLSQGAHIVTYAVRDGSGNAASLTTRFFVDSVSPMLSLSPVNGRALNTNQPTLSAMFVDPEPSSGLNYGQLRLVVDGSDWTSRFTRGSVQATLQVPADAPLADGPHTFQAHLADNASNSVDQESTFVTDTTPPSIAVVNPSNGSTIVTSSPLLEVVFFDSLGGTGITTASFEALLDGVDRARDFEVSPTGARLQIPTTALLAQGSHQLAVAISDGVGHRATTSIMFTVETVVSAPNAPPNAGKAVGVVVDAATDQPIPGAAVTVEGIPGTILTDATGRYVFPLAPGDYLVLVSKPGYAGPIGRPVVIQAERDTAIPVVALVLQDAKVTSVTVAAGATATNSAGTIKLELPPGSLTQDAQIRITPLTQVEALPGTLPPTFLTGMSFNVDTGGAQLTHPVTVTSPNAHNLQPGHRLMAMAFEEETQTWECIGGGQVSADGTTVVAHINHLSPIGYS